MTDGIANPRTERHSIEERIGVIEELLGERYSCRAFQPDPVPRPTIERILQAAQRTASWCNSQPWQVVIASGPAKERFRKEIYASGQFRRAGRRRLCVSAGISRRLSGAPPGKRFPALQHARHRARRQAAYAKQALENYNFFGAPHVAVIHTDEALGIYGAIDCGAYVGNFMLAAQALGLGTIAQAALARQSGLIRRHFKLGDDRRVVCGISFGFPDHDHRINSYRTSRAGLAETVTFVDE